MTGDHFVVTEAAMMWFIDLIYLRDDDDNDDDDDGDDVFSKSEAN